MNQMPRATPEEPDETQEVGGTESKQNISKKKKKKKKKKKEEEEKEEEKEKEKEKDSWKHFRFEMFQKCLAVILLLESL